MELATPIRNRKEPLMDPPVDGGYKGWAHLPNQIVRALTDNPADVPKPACFIKDVRRDGNRDNEDDNDGRVS